MPPKIRCDSASAVSAGWPKVLPRKCAPSLRAEAAPPGVDEDHGAEVGGGRPDRVEGRVGELAAVDVGRDADALEAELADGALQLADGDGRVLQRQRAEAVQPARPCAQCAATASLITVVSLTASSGSAQYRCIGIGPDDLGVHADGVQVGQSPVDRR